MVCSPKQLFRRCMEPFARYSSWDCLMYHPNHNTNHMRLEVLPLLWRKIWDNWHRIPLTRKCPETPTQSQLLTMSIWLQIHPLFLVPGSNGPTSLAVALKHHRPSTSSSPKKACIAWTISSPHNACGPPMKNSSCKWSLTFGGSLATIFHACFAICTPCFHSLRPMYGKYWVSLSRKLCLLIVKFNSPSDKSGRMSLFLFNNGRASTSDRFVFVRHYSPSSTPCRANSRNSDLAIKKYINTTVKPLMRYPTPLQADVWWRILFRMLPVNSRFFFLQDTNPSIIECSYPGCSAVETMQHILFDCKFVKPVWNWHQAAWRPFGIPFTWNTIINLDEFAVSEEWVPQFSVIRRLWVLLVSTLLRDFWIHRNRTKFEGKPVPYIQAVKEVSLVSWTANIRRMLRDPTIDSDEAMQVSEIVDKLKSHTNYTWFWQKNLRATLV
ncbi:hypothetical protein Ae201684P_013563 [Aphanomyces euteiches]|nr:hypothetical protein Ae201684P_013563 [Aphanomyces euteiches]